MACAPNYHRSRVWPGLQLVAHPGVQVLELSSAALSHALAGSLLRTEQLRLNRHSDMECWHYIIMLRPMLLKLSPVIYSYGKAREQVCVYAAGKCICLTSLAGFGSAVIIKVIVALIELLSSVSG